MRARRVIHISRSSRQYRPDYQHNTGETQNASRPPPDSEAPSAYLVEQGEGQTEHYADQRSECTNKQNSDERKDYI